MALRDRGSVTRWVQALQAGDESATRPLWDRYFTRLIGLARGHLTGVTDPAVDPEDVALSAFNGFCVAARQGRYASLADRDEFWRLLVAITANRARNLRKAAGRLKRSPGRSPDPGPGSLAGPHDHGSLDDELREFLDREPDPQHAWMVLEECRSLLAILEQEDPALQLREIALRKLEGMTNQEIAARMSCSRKTVGVRIQFIRRLWQVQVDR